METESLLPLVLKSLAPQSLGILVCLAACVVIVSRWSTLRSAAWPAVLGFGLKLLLSIVFPIVWIVLTRTQGGAPSSVLPIVSGIQSFLWAVAMVLVLLGVVMGRSPDRPQ